MNDWIWTRSSYVFFGLYYKRFPGKSFLMKLCFFLFFMYDVTKETGPYLVKDWSRESSSYIFSWSSMKEHSNITIFDQSIYIFFMCDVPKETGLYVTKDCIRGVFANFFLDPDCNSFSMIPLLTKSRTNSWTCLKTGIRNEIIPSKDLSLKCMLCIDLLAITLGTIKKTILSSLRERLLGYLMTSWEFKNVYHKQNKEHCRDFSLCTDHGLHMLSNINFL